MGGTTSLLFSLLVLIAHQLGEALLDDNFPTVTLYQGTLMGQKVIPDNLAPYYSFLGIPYAKPPVGNLRFKAPVPAEPWNGTLNALKEGNICKQPGYNAGRTPVGDEDCLFLNVYTPQLCDSCPLKPVMVFIHGGGFLSGSGNNDAHGPQYLVNAGVVYVSFNYRLGIFGFLTTEDEVVPGNAAMKDQVLALRWVQQNIASFGGDPNQVTVYGTSVGGASVQYHLLSPMSKGLFHRAIAQSGSIFCPWSLADNPRENAFSVGRALGFTGDSSQALVEFLLNISSDELLATSLVTINKKDYYRLTSKFHQLPSLEPEVEGEMAFISEDPETLLKEGKFHKVPYITGVTSAEGLFIVTDGIFSSHRTLEEVDEEFLNVFRPELRLKKEDTRGDEIVAMIRSFYMEDKPLNNDTLKNFIDVCTDFYFAVGVVRAVKLMSMLSSEPVYFYQFSYDGGLAFLKNTYPGVLNVSGVAHADDLGYIFDYGKQVPNDSLDAKVRSRMVTMWTNFAKTGNPTPEVTEEFPAWPPYTSSATNYLDIGPQLEVKRDYRKERMDFWDCIYSSM